MCNKVVHQNRIKYAANEVKHLLDANHIKRTIGYFPLLLTLFHHFHIQYSKRFLISTLWNPPMQCVNETAESISQPCILKP